jgi:hypothetical protein
LSGDYVVRARTTLKQLRTWFEVKGWKVLPRDKHRWRRLYWIADFACVAYPRDQKRAIRRECLKVAPDLSDDDIHELTAHTRDSNKWWTADMSAAVWGISARARDRHKLWGFGANDVPNYEWRIQRNLEKDAQRKRDERAAKSTGRPRGRPGLNMTPAEKKAHRNAQAAERMKRYRLRKNPSAPIRTTADALKRNADLPPPPTPVDRSRAPQASRRVHNVTVGDEDSIILVSSPPICPARAPKSAPRPGDATEDDGGCALATPPPDRSERGYGKIISSRSAT